MNVPAGLEEGVEIYLHNSHLRVLVDGKRIDYDQLPAVKRTLFSAELNNKRVIECLSAMGCPPEEMESKLVACRYGAINEVPDLIGNTTFPDPPRCENIGHCPGYGTVCLIPDGLTKQEYQVARLIALGKQDIEICYHLDIARPTCRTYIERIHEKLHLNNRNEIGLWAQKLGIV